MALSKRARKVAKAAVLVSTSVGALAAAIALLASGTHVEAVPSLPFGLFVLSGVALLLSGDGLADLICRRADSESGANGRAASTAPWHALTVAECLQRLRLADASASEVANVLPKPEPPSIWRSLLNEVQEAQQALLLFVAVLYAFVGEVEEAAMALGVIALMVVAETITEYRAKRALQSLQTSTPQFAYVCGRSRRDGHADDELGLVEDQSATRVPRETVRVGDIILLQAGFEVPADARLLTSAGLEVEESRFTGEVVPAQKDPTSTLATDSPLSERCTMVFSGTVVTRGHGKALVVATGPHTQLGQLLLSVEKAKKKQKEKKTALQSLLKSLAGKLTIVALLGSLLGGLLGLVPNGSLPRRSWQSIVLTTLSLAFATIPEELPILIAAVLAVGAQSLSRRSVFVKRLRAVEALAYLDTLLTDKTGTLTQNKLKLCRVIAPDGRELPVPSSGESASPELLAILSAWRSMPQAGAGGLDPFEAAVGEVTASLRGTDAAFEPTVSASSQEVPFDSETKIAARFIEGEGGGSRVYLKGAPEAVIARCGGDGANLQNLALVAERAATKGFRMVALASAELPSSLAGMPTPTLASITTARVIGILCFYDPLRPEVPACVEECKAAGISVMMVSGDHPAAALTIARQAGLLAPSDTAASAAMAEEGTASAVLNCSSIPDLSAGCTADQLSRTMVFARATPLNKLQLVNHFQSNDSNGHERCVAVTGDGVNDAAALAAADVGIAVANATDVAREAASMVVVGDGDFSALLLAIREGRRLYDNLVAALAFYLGVKLGLLTIMVAAPLWSAASSSSSSSSGDGDRVPRFLFTPVQIIVLELFMDIGASLSFVTEPAEAGIMTRKPRSKRDRFFDLTMILRILAGGISISAAVLVGFWKTSSSNVPFLAFLFGHILLAFNQRSAVEPVLIAKGPWRLIGSNLVFTTWLLAVAVFALLVAFIPGLRTSLGLSEAAIPPSEWGTAVVVCLVCTWWIEAVKLVLWAGRKLWPARGKAMTTPAAYEGDGKLDAPLLSQS